MDTHHTDTQRIITGSGSPHDNGSFGHPGKIRESWTGLFFGVRSSGQYCRPEVPPRTGQPLMELPDHTSICDPMCGMRPSSICQITHVL